MKRRSSPLVTGWALTVQHSWSPRMHLGHRLISQQGGQGGPADTPLRWLPPAYAGWFLEKPGWCTTSNRAWLLLLSVQGAGGSVSIYRPDRLLLLSQHAVGEGQSEDFGAWADAWAGDMTVWVTAFLASSLDLWGLGSGREATTLC